MNIPLSTMTFNERLDFFKNKKGLDIQKIKSNLINKESNIYTFCPRTNKTFATKANEKRSKRAWKSTASRSCFFIAVGIYLVAPQREQTS